MAPHIGIFVVWLPTILMAQRLTKSVKQAEFWKAALRGCPPWVKPGAYALGTYAVLNFIVFVVQVGTYPRNEVPDLVGYRGFSGHWMVFYYLGAATLYSAVRLGDLAQRKCPLGHDVSPFAKYCDVCGVELAPPLTP